MNKCRINIAVLESSDIIYEGLSNLLLKSGEHYYLYRIKDMEDLSRRYGDISFNIAIINPVALQNKKHEFQKLKNTWQELIWVGMIYSFFDNRILNFFDDIFSITDTSEVIINKLNKLLQKCDGNNNNLEHLSERETEVLIQLVKGLSHKEIADKLNISIHTVTSHRKNIIEKTGIKSLSGLTIYAITKKIIPLEIISTWNDGKTNK